MNKLIPITIELVGISVTGIGIGLEIHVGGEIYLLVITIGALLISTGGVLWGKFMRRV